MSGSLTDYRPTIAEGNEIKVVVQRWLSFYATVKGVGSFGRHQYDEDQTQTIGDIDLLLVAHDGTEESCPNDLAKVRDMVGLLFGKHSTGTPVTSGIIGRAQVDIFYATPQTEVAVKEFYSLPRNLQIALRVIAAAKGYTLGPKGLRERDTERVISLFDRKGLYALLGMDAPFTDAEMKSVEKYKMETIE